MNDRWRTIVLLLACVAQLGAALALIGGAESTLVEGSAYRLRTIPVDPPDFFRGRYVQLAFAPVTLPQPGGPPLEAGEKVLAAIEHGPDRVARFTGLHRTPPEGVDYLEVAIDSANPHRATFRPPFDRFYMEEHAAIDLERRLGTGRSAWVTVRVHQGRGVVEDVRLDEAEPPRFSMERVTVVADEPVPDALVEALLGTDEGARFAACGTTVECVLFPVELDGQPGSEYVFQDPQRRLYYYAPTPVPARGPGTAPEERSYRRVAVLRPVVGQRPPVGSALVQVLREHGATPRPPPYRDLAIGDTVLAVRR